MELLEALTSGVVVADGAMGTLLHSRGAGQDSCLEHLCVSRPELIQQVHRDYLVAGAQLIRTHSFGSNAARLAQWGLERHVGELNWLAARIARDAAKGTGAIVAGSVGPTGQGAKGGALLEEQIGALLDGGAQCVIFETFTDVEELLIAIEVKQSLHHCPAVAMLSVGAPTSPWTRLREAGADIVGSNCVGTPPETLAAFAGADLSEMAAFPSAGIPDASGNYRLGSAEFADGACALVARGIRLIGGCCGTTPAHIGALAARLAPSPE